jgi:two-component system, chemotaxis family, CheB/CheR fusion protein
LLPENRAQADYFQMLRKLKKLESQVEKGAKQLELAKASFLKNLYHEIRTPLNSIMGFTNLIARENKLGQVEKEEYIVLMNKSSTEFLRVMDDIIQASLLEAGMVNVKNDVCHLGAFLDEIHSFFNIRKHVLKKNSIALLRYLPDKHENIQVMIDKQRVNQVFSHLLENAFKFTERGTIEFGFTIKEQQIEFYVKDSGVGKLSGKEKFIFGSFTKIDFSDDSKNGLGLGLSICKDLVSLMGGEIWCHSRPGKGATFYFTVPLQLVEAPGSEKTNNGSFIGNVLKSQNSLAV